MADSSIASVIGGTYGSGPSVVRRLHRQGHGVAFTDRFAVAAPEGELASPVFEAFRSAIIKSTRETRPDAVFLGLHGSMLTETDTDPEGTLPCDLRNTLGPQILIGVALGRHAHIADELTSMEFTPKTSMSAAVSG